MKIFQGSYINLFLIEKIPFNVYIQHFNYDRVYYTV